MTIYIAPDCPAEVDRMIREDAKRRGEDVMPRRPFPWNRPGKAEPQPLPLMLAPLSDDQRETLERHWQRGSAAPKPQRPCDHGLFSDAHKQLELLSIPRKDRT